MKTIFVISLAISFFAFGATQETKLCNMDSLFIGELNDGTAPYYLIPRQDLLATGRFPHQSERKRNLLELTSNERTIILGEERTKEELLKIVHEEIVIAPDRGHHACIYVITGDAAKKALQLSGLQEDL